MARFYGGIEAGGTKFVCAIASAPPVLDVVAQIATTTPSRTLQEVIDFFRQHERTKPLSSLGIASFGPIDVRAKSPTYGHITRTPKPNWSNTDVVGVIHGALNVPIAFDLDTRGAAAAEYRWGAAEGLASFLYVTVGTGIGGGAMFRGEFLDGVSPAEMGHLLVRIEGDDPFEGNCPFHKACLEGLASGPALRARWGRPAEELPSDHPAWSLEARYLAQAIASYIGVLAPHRIILGGGVMKQRQLFPMIGSHVQKLLNGYVDVTEISTDIASYIVPPKLSHDAGVLGAIALGQRLVGGHEDLLEGSFHGRP